MPVLFALIGIAIWIILPDEITQPVDDAVKKGASTLIGYLKKGPKEPFEE